MPELITHRHTYPHTHVHAHTRTKTRTQTQKRNDPPNQQISEATLAGEVLLPVYFEKYQNPLQNTVPGTSTIMFR